MNFIVGLYVAICLTIGCINDCEAKYRYRISGSPSSSKPWNLGAKTSAKKGLATRATQIHRAAEYDTQKRTTVALTKAIDKNTGQVHHLVSSNEPRLRKSQRAELNGNETPVNGAAGVHAEVKGIEYAKANNMRPTMTAASRPICHDCQNVMNDNNVKAASPRKSK